MKLKSVCFLVFLLLIGCKNEDRLTFETYLVTNDPCLDCPTVEIAIPRVLEETKSSHVINSSIKEEIISLLNFNESSDAASLKGAIFSFTEDYKKLNNKFNEDTTPWEATIEGKTIFENNTLVSVVIDSYIFAGGAHGYSTVSYLNFNKTKSKELNTKDLFKNYQSFKLFAEEKFRIQENISTNTPINSTGFMFDKEEFSLPTNIGYTKNGLQLHYQPYEIAPYTDGAIIIDIPYTEVNSYLVHPIIL